MAYAKRYAGGFVDKPTLTTPIDSTFLNAVEAALLKLFDADPSVDGQVLQWINASTKYGPALLLNKNIDPAAAIASSKIDFTGGNAITNAAIAGAAAISRSKLDFGSGLVNADIAAAAAIATSKIAGYLPGATLLRKTTAKAVNTTVAATDLLNGEITLPVLASTTFVRLTAEGDILHNSGATDGLPRFQLLLGATTLLDTGASGTWVSNAARWQWKIEATIANLGSVSSQSAFIKVTVTGQNGPSSACGNNFTAGIGWTYVVGSQEVMYAEGRNTSAVNTGVAAALVLNVINAASSATYETRLTSALVEVI